MTTEKHLTNGQKKPQGMMAFLIVWVGQFVSILASGMSGFALSIWMYQQTESATAMGLMQVFYITPFLLLSPIAGVMVDRYNRKLMMMLSDMAAGVATLAILAFSASGRLEFWMLYGAAILYGLGNTFQWPAYSAAITTMIPKEQLGRANGLMSLLEAGPAVFAPLLAGILLPLVGLNMVLLIDVATFLLAIAALAVVFIPPPLKTQEGAQAQGGVLKEAGFGFKYIFERPSLLGLQLVFFVGNLFSGMAMTLFAPMVLARTEQNALIFGSTQTLGAIGGVVGGVAISAWGGFKRRVHGVLLGWMISGLSLSLLGISQGLTGWAVALLIGGLMTPLINSSNQSIWQAKVAPDLQGRVFSARRLIAWFSTPISPILAGVLADFVFEPRMLAGGVMTSAFSPLVGSGPGAGMGLLVAICGLGAALVGLLGYFIQPVRAAEDLLPDYDQLALAEE